MRRKLQMISCTRESIARIACNNQLTRSVQIRERDFSIERFWNKRTVRSRYTYPRFEVRHVPSNRLCIKIGQGERANVEINQIDGDGVTKTSDHRVANSICSDYFTPFISRFDPSQCRFFKFLAHLTILRVSNFSWETWLNSIAREQEQIRSFVNELVAFFPRIPAILLSQIFFSVRLMWSGLIVVAFASWQYNMSLRHIWPEHDNDHE